MKKRKRKRAVAVVAAVAVAVNKQKKIGQGKGILQPYELMETRTGSRMMNATVKSRKRNDSNLKENNRQRTNNNPNHNNRKRRKTLKQIKIKYMDYILHVHFSTPQLHSQLPILEETLAIIRTISLGDLRRYKEREPERKQQKLQQYAGLTEIVEKFHEIMKQIVEEEKQKPKVMQPGQYKKYPNKDDHVFFFPPKNLQNAVIGLIAFTAEQIVQSETESKDQEQLTNELERIVAVGTYDNREEVQSELAIKFKRFINGNDGHRKNVYGKLLKVSINREANLQINITKISANILLLNVNRSDRFGGNGYGTQLQAAANENENLNHKTIQNTSNANDDQQTNDNKAEKNENKQGLSNENQHQQGTKHRVIGNTELKVTGSLHTTHPKQELGNPSTSQSKKQSPLINTPPEVVQAKERVAVSKQRI
ncbi:MAG: hypothetical protein EZS28_018002 [Streblomastix strix]|uniref:Uncharacterized protein n=1 Tax=Streblomastix strix TaxID=222440 RepID=A0A5J4VW12_9EUKA|nr:MAG: hypothetical protein EZS28_018002 [Streblomastix strix]